jgi:hypothetical protein
VYRYSDEEIALLNAYNVILDLIPDIRDQLSYTLDYHFRGVMELAKFVSILLFLPVLL